MTRGDILDIYGRNTAPKYKPRYIDMAGGPKPTTYVNDNGTNFYYPLHTYLATAQGGTTPAQGTYPKWPYKRSWMRHINILFSDGTRDELPIMSSSNTYFLNGGSITVAFPSGSKTGVVTGRRGEKVHLAHS